MKRRSFFQGLLKAAAIVALAPQLAFRVPEVKAVVKPPLNLKALFKEAYLIARQVAPHPGDDIIHFYITSDDCRRVDITSIRLADIPREEIPPWDPHVWIGKGGIWERIEGVDMRPYLGD